MSPILFCFKNWKRQTSSVSMDFMRRGSVFPTLCCCRPVEHVQHIEARFGLPRGDIECLYKMRDAIKQEIVKDFIWGKAPSKEFRKWLEKVGEIELRVNDMEKMQQQSSELDADLRNILYEITGHIDSFPLGHHLMAKRPVKTSKNLNLDIKSETEGVQNVRDDISVTGGKKTAPRKIELQRKAQSIESSIPVLEHKRNQGFVAAEAELTPQQRSDMMWEISAEFEVVREGETAPTPVTKSLSADLAPASSVEAPPTREMISPARTGTLSTHESEIELVSDENDRVLSIHGTETSVVFSHDEGGQTKPESRSVVPTTPVPLSTSGPGNKAAVDSKKMSPSMKKDRFLAVGGETDIPLQTEGSQSFLEPGILAKRSIEVVHEGETAPTPITKSLSADLAPASSMEAVTTREMISPARTGTLFPHESEIELVSIETEGFLSMQPESRSVVPPMPVPLSTSGPGNKVAKDSKKMPPLRKKDGVIERTVQKILVFLSDNTVRRIGVHGIGGIGKTSVLEALINHPEIKSLFNVIIQVTLSRYWSRRKIQNEVLRQLSLSMSDSETDSKIAEKLLSVLHGRKFLLVLDDVWELIDLTAVGIPDLSSENGCKMILATRLLDVCDDNAVDNRLIKVETLSSEEAWELFHEQVGRTVDSPDIKPFAQAIVKKCGGLPLLIIVTGRALKEDDDVTVWKQVLEEFSLPSTLGTYGFEAVIQQLKLSYDRLNACDIKSCFLYCALFSEDEEVDILNFVDYCIQEGLISGSWAAAHKRGHDIVNVLVGASLLQSTSNGRSIKMHDLIRDLALGILLSEAEGCQFLLRAYSSSTEPSNSRSVLSLRPRERSESNRLFIPRAGAGLREPPLREEEWKQAKMIFLMDNELSTLPEKPNCPNLLTLFFQRNDRLREIPMSFFDFMPHLTVLNLSRTRIKSLPQTLSKLRELQFLILRDCERLAMLPSQVESLQHLEVLDLRGTEINRLPDEVGNLAILRHLEVTFYGSVSPSEHASLPHELISPEIISRLLALRTLSVVVYPGDHRWNKNVNFVTVEVSRLTKLTSLCFYFPEVDLLKQFIENSTAWIHQGLADFKFVVGQDFKRIVSRVPRYVEYDYAQQGQCLRFVNGDEIPDAVVKVLARSTAFYLDHHLRICSLSKFGVSNVKGLKLCIVSESPKIETIVDSKGLTTMVFPCLEHLSLHYLWNLTSIWEGMVPEGSFAVLRILSVHACPKLKYVFTSTMLQCVSKLEELVVEDCPDIKDIVFDDVITESGSLLHLSLKKLTLHYLPGLVNIWKGALPSLEHVSFYNCPNLKTIGIDSKWNYSIKEIKAEKDWWDALEWEEAEFFSCRFTPICDDDL